MLADPGIEEVRTLARRDLPAGLDAARRRDGCRLIHTRADLRSVDARSAMTGVDLLYHLGFQLWTGRAGPAAMESVNIEGTENVLAAGPARVVLASSAAVYGAWAANPCPLRETDAPRPNRECAYAVHKLAAERICAAAAPTVSLRMAAVLGANADRHVRRAVTGYRLVVPVMSGVPVALQFVDEADVIAALVAAGRGTAGPGAGSKVDIGDSGVFNVAPADWLDAAGVAAISGGRVLALPRRALMGASRLGRRVGLLPFGVDRSVLLSGPLALDPSAAADHLGWRARRSSADALYRMLRGVGGTGATPSSAGPPWPPAGR